MIEELTDESIMPSGKYKGEKLANVPAHYLLFCYEHGKVTQQMRKYIDKNKDDMERERAENE